VFLTQVCCWELQSSELPT